MLLEIELKQSFKGPEVRRAGLIKAAVARFGISIFLLGEIQGG